MDVTCERCSTEYEFDDALVSERGTTVKCTNCGYQFKVRRTDGSLPEQWVVRTVDGRELEFKMLRELQAAITHAQITRDDVISRGSSRPRRLGSIAELEPFFTHLSGGLMLNTAHGIGPAPVPGRVRTMTPQGLGPSPSHPEGSVAIPLPKPDDGSERAPDSLSDSETVVIGARPQQAPRSRASESRSGARRGAAPSMDLEPETTSLGRAAAVSGALPGVVVPPGEAPPLPDGYAGHAAEARAAGRSAASSDRRRGAARAASDNGRRDLGAQPQAAASRIEVAAAGAAPDEDTEAESPQTRRGGTPRRAAVVGRGERRNAEATSHPATATPQEARSSYFDDGYGDPRFTSLSPASRKTGVARWIVGLVALGLAVLSVMTLGAKYLKSTAQGRPQASDERIPTLLHEGERSLNDGDLETARDKFVKASALAEDDPRVAEALARLETVSADVRWLRVQMLDADDPDLEAAKQELSLALQRAHKAVDHARRVAPADTAVTRLAIDVLRIEGDREGARKLVGAISVASAQPENALTLAALDLAEAQPSWAAVIERLRMAASSEQNLGRARALLIYALARSGDLAAARAEHDRLVAASRPHPLARALRAFVDRLEKTKSAGDAAGRGAATTKGSEARPAAAPAEMRPRVSHDLGDPPPPAGARGAPPRSPDDARVPDDYVAPGGTIDTSDLPGVKPPHVAPPPTASATAGKPVTDVDTSDLPGTKHD